MSKVDLFKILPKFCTYQDCIYNVEGLNIDFLNYENSTVTCGLITIHDYSSKVLPIKDVQFINEPNILSSTVDRNKARFKYKTEDLKMKEVLELTNVLADKDILSEFNIKGDNYVLSSIKI